MFMKLESDRIFLRAVEKEDATKLMIWENNPDYWRVSDTEMPFSMHSIINFVERQENFRNTGQQRLMICLKSDKSAIGCVDLYDGNIKFRRAAIGILIADEIHQNHGYAKEALTLLTSYATNILDLHQLYCYIDINNQASMALFKSCGFEKSGILKDWKRWNKKWSDVVVFQKILSTKNDEA
jgi:diamine N-acetyltransferase